MSCINITNVKKATKDKKVYNVLRSSHNIKNESQVLKKAGRKIEKEEKYKLK